MNKIFKYILLFTILVPGIVIGMYLGEIRTFYMIKEGKLGIACTK